MNSEGRKLEKSSLPCWSRASTEARGERFTSSAGHFRGSVLAPDNKGSAEREKPMVGFGLLNKKTHRHTQREHSFEVVFLNQRQNKTCFALK